MSMEMVVGDKRVVLLDLVREKELYMSWALRQPFDNDSGLFDV